MKILVVQLARLGDIYQTWPTLVALTGEGHQVDVLVRSRFIGATKGLPSSINVIQLPNKNILSYVFDGRDAEAIAEMGSFCQSLIDKQYDRIINLSFSPFSSWLCWTIKNDSEIRGYTRHDDGFFNITDDTSAYFYAQVGPQRKARLHITNLFAGVAGVDLNKIHLHYGKKILTKRTIENPYWTVQLKASDDRKSLTSAQWVYALRLLSELFDRMIVLVGSEDDFSFAENVKLSTGYHNILNLCGQTTPYDLFDWIGHAELHLCPDSMTTHIASLVNTPTLNISLDSVNFWETGPLANNSYVLMAGEQNDLHAKDLVSVAQAALTGEPPEVGYRYREQGLESYVANSVAEERANQSSFSWRLTLALYLSGDLPRTSDVFLKNGLEKTLSVLELGLQQIEILKSQPDNNVVMEILNQVDHLLSELETLMPPLAPFFRWFNAERIRIPPEERMHTLMRTQSVFTQGHMVASRLLEEALYGEQSLCS